MNSNGNNDPSAEDMPQGQIVDADEGQSHENLASFSRAELQETAPSEGARKALGAAAEIIIKRSKQVLDTAVRVTAHQPLSLSWDAIVEPASIRQVLSAVGETTSYPPSQLVLMASNSLETLPLARDCRKRFIDKLTRDGSPPTPGSEAWRLAAPNSPLNQLLTILSKIESGDLEEAERMISAAVDTDPTFNHPVVADFMCSRLADRNEDSEVLRAWLYRALFFRIFELRLIEMLIAIERPEDHELMAQLATVAAKPGGESK